LRIGKKEEEMYAIIRTGGKQYKVREGDILEVEKLENKGGKEVVFGEVLLLRNEREVLVGKPVLKQAKVLCEFLEEVKGEKVIAFKYRRRKDSKTKKGHRQILTRLRVKKILLEEKNS